MITPGRCLGGGRTTRCFVFTVLDTLKEETRSTSGVLTWTHIRVFWCPKWRACLVERVKRVMRGPDPGSLQVSPALCVSFFCSWCIDHPFYSGNAVGWLVGLSVCLDLSNTMYPCESLVHLLNCISSFAPSVPPRCMSLVVVVVLLSRFGTQ